MTAPAGEPSGDLRSNAIDVLHAWRPSHDDEGDRRQQGLLRRQFLDFLATRVDAMWRTSRSGHLTASTLVVAEPGDRVLLTLHPKVGRWLQLGGHCEEGDLTLSAAALREAQEESGIPQVRLSPEPVRLDRHRVQCAGSVTWHLDVQYLGWVASDAQPQRSAESIDLRWWPLADPPEDIDPSVAALVQDARSARLAR